MSSLMHLLAPLRASPRARTARGCYFRNREETKRPCDRPFGTAGESAVAHSITRTRQNCRNTRRHAQYSQDSSKENCEIVTRWLFLTRGRSRSLSQSWCSSGANYGLRRYPARHSRDNSLFGDFISVRGFRVFSQRESRTRPLSRHGHVILARITPVPMWDCADIWRQILFRNIIQNVECHIKMNYTSP